MCRLRHDDAFSNTIFNVDSRKNRGVCRLSGWNATSFPEYLGVVPETHAKHGQSLLLQSIGGSLRLPLFQNGACPFPCTPLLGVLMLVTHPDREVLTMCPGLRSVAVSMSGLEIALAGVPSMPADVVTLQRVIMLEAQPTVGTAPALSCEPRGQSGTTRGVASPSGAPIHPIPIVRTPMACDLGVPQARNLTMGGARHLALGDGRRGTHPAGVPPRPVPGVYPPGRGVGVSSACPVAARYPSAVIMGPTSDLGFLGATEQKTGISSECRFVNVYISANSRQMR
jgi:hypothetical protein